MWIISTNFQNQSLTSSKLNVQYQKQVLSLLVRLVATRGVTIYQYIGIWQYKEFISYRNTKCVLQYIEKFPSSNETLYFSFISCHIAIESVQGVCLSHL